MSFTTATVTHTFTNADQTAASGSIQFSLTGRMTNGSTSIIPASIIASLDNSGNLSQELTSNLDADTVPQDTQWRVTFRIMGAEEEEFVITVPSGGGTVDLGSLLPGTQQVT